MTQVKYHENKVKTRENKCKYMKIHMKTQSIARGHISDEKRPKTAGRGAQTVVPYSKMLATKLGTQNIRNHQILGAFFMLNPNIADKTKKNQKNQKLYPYLPVIFQFLFLSSENSCAHMYMLLFYRDSAFLPCRSSTSIFTSIFLFHFPKKFSDFYKIFRDFSIFVSIKTCENS